MLSTTLVSEVREIRSPFWPLNGKMVGGKVHKLPGRPQSEDENTYLFSLFCQFQEDKMSENFD